ncbi:MAG TPA: GntR family transcriptional regulator [Bacteroidales bacterium]|nr:GntR family transcriptional regulator [Bacteroidales bacterium]
MEKLYQKLHGNLKSLIIGGIYHEGDLLPSENELMQSHGVTRSTVRQALVELVREGYIVKQQGKGSIVQKQRRRTLGLLSVKGFSEVVSSNHLAVHTVMIQKPVVTSWIEPFFYPLDETEWSAGCIYLKRIRCVDDEPVMLESTYIPNVNLPRFCSSPFVRGSLFETLSVNHQVEITRVDQDLRAVTAGAEASEHLGVQAGSPLLHIFIKFHSNREHLNVYSSLLCNTMNYSIGNKL